MSNTCSRPFDRGQWPRPAHTAGFRACELRRGDAVSCLGNGRSQGGIIYAVRGFAEQHIQGDSSWMRAGELIEHLGCEAATPRVTTEPREARFVNRDDGNVIRHP